MGSGDRAGVYSFDDLLARAAEQTLQDIVGRHVVRLLGRIDPALVQPDRLRDVAMGLRTPSEMMLEPATRRELLSLLPREQATLLARALKLDEERPYAEFEALSIRKGSDRERALLDFFSLPLPEARTAELPPSSIEIKASHGLFPHQRVATRRVVQNLRREPRRVLLHMPTGSGKTRTAMNVIAELLNDSEPSLVVWLAHSEELCEQAVEEFERTWASLGNRTLPVHRWWGAHDAPPPTMRDGLVVAGLSKVYHSARRSIGSVGWMAGRVSLVVMDEAHQAIAPTYDFVLSLLTQAGSPAPMLGLSATPGRTWNDLDEDQRLADFFFRRKVSLELDGYSNPIDYLVDEGYLASVEHESLTHQSSIELTSRDLNDLAAGLEIPPRVIKQLAEDEQRNLLVVHRVERLARRHNRILVFAASVENAHVLATVLQSRGLWARAVTGTTPGGERARLIADYKREGGDVRILVNYGVLTTGFDAPQTSGAIIARPTNSLVLYSQMVGRAIRGPRAGGNATAEIVTVVDTALPGFGSLAEGFHNWEDVWEN